MSSSSYKESTLWVCMAAVVVGTTAALLQTIDNERKKRNKKNLKVTREPGAKAWRMSKWIKKPAGYGIMKTQGLVGDFDKIPGSSTAQQTMEALTKLDQILKEAGLKRSNLTSIQIYIADYDKNFFEMNEVYDEWIKGCEGELPTRICVQAYMGPGFEIEIQAEAYYYYDNEG